MRAVRTLLCSLGSIEGLPRPTEGLSREGLLKVNFGRRPSVHHHRNRLLINSACCAVLPRGHRFFSEDRVTESVDTYSKALDILEPLSEAMDPGEISD